MLMQALRHAFCILLPFLCFLLTFTSHFLASDLVPAFRRRSFARHLSIKCHIKTKLSVFLMVWNGFGRPPRSHKIPVSHPAARNRCSGRPTLPAPAAAAVSLMKSWERHDSYSHEVSRYAPLISHLRQNCLCPGSQYKKYAHVMMLTLPRAG